MNPRITLIPALLASCLLVAGCFGTDKLPEETTTSIAPEGGTATSPDGKLVLRFPAGALTAPVEVTIGANDEVAVTGQISRLYILGPDATQFAAGVTITLDVSGVTPTGQLHLANVDGASPELVEGSAYDPATQTISGQLRHFSNYVGIDLWAPCANAACGDTCSNCSPADPNCIETQEIKVCNANGACVSDTGAISCGGGGGGTYDPCANKACGDACTQCDPTDAGCLETAVLKYCDVNGGCGMAFPSCANPGDPCNGLTCGDPCDYCGADVGITCADPATDPIFLGYCNTNGSCSLAFPLCGGPPASECGSDADCASDQYCQVNTYCPDCTTAGCVCETYGTCEPDLFNPCDDASACGDVCAPCETGDPTCTITAVMYYCDDAGACTSSVPVCGGPGVYEPCANKVCGDLCTLCAPNDPDCFETEVIKTCDDVGFCSAGPSSCGSSCGGIVGDVCPPGQVCIDDPTDTCDQATGGADCIGQCVDDCTTDPNGCGGSFCGGFAGILCPAGQMCIDDPTDSCDPTLGGADCGGICVPDDGLSP